MRVILDMDGVLVDLYAGLASSFGTDILQHVDNFNSPRIEALWKTVDSSWWEHLPWTEDGVAILRLLELEFGQENISLCTKPTVRGSSHAGKFAWIEWHLPEYLDQYIFTRNKALIASPEYLLVDDSHDNIDAFIKAGGKGLLVPRAWNRGGHCLNVPAHIKNNLGCFLPAKAD